MMEKAMASGIKASATTVPARESPLMFENQSRFIESIIYYLLNLKEK
jgi:hypothetical protein